MVLEPNCNQNEPLNDVPALALKGIPEDVLEWLRQLADAERRSLDQQDSLLLERALAEAPQSFKTAYRQFREAQGRSRPFADGQIAAIAATRDLTLVTRNTADFAPFEEPHVENSFA